MTYFCPHCPIQLTHYKVYERDETRTAEFEICDSCFGIWLDKEDMVNRPPVDLRKSLEIDYESIMPSRRTCPKCRNVSLVAMRYKELSTTIDCCPSCFGTWLDGGELQEFCDFLHEDDQDVIDVLVDNAVFKNPAFSSMLKHFSKTLHELDSQLSEQEKNLDQARDIQSRLIFKNRAPQSVTSYRFGSYEIASFWNPAKTVGGDYFDFIPFTHDGVEHLGICIADVSGKGLPASLLMASMQALLTSFAPTVQSPRELCSQLNSIFYHNSSQNKFITMIYGVLNLETHEYTYTNAGHNPALVQLGKEQEWLKIGGTVLGLFPEWEYMENTIKLDTGDRLILYTDGVSETQNPKGDEFEEDHLAELVEQFRDKPLAETHKLIVREIIEFNRGVYNDDTTLLLIERQ